MTTYALDATPMLGHRTGIGRCVSQLANGVIQRLQGSESLVLYATPFGRNPWTGVSLEPLQRLATHERVRLALHWTPYPLLRPAWNHFDCPSLDRRIGPIDAFLGTNYRLPPTRARRIATFYDVALLEDPSLAPPRIARRFRATVTAAARHADRVVTISEQARQEIRRHLGVEPERIDVIRPGIEEYFRARGDADADRALLRDRYGLGDDFLLFVGTTDPRKNLDRLLRAFARCLPEPGFPSRLVLIGQAGFGSPSVEARLNQLGLGESVLRPGFVPDSDLPSFYRRARLLAFPSLIEGFGLPVVEAMAAGCPVVTSNASCLPEVAGGAAELVDPRNVESIARGLRRVAHDSDRARQLVTSGHERARDFTWEGYVEQHLELLRRTASPRAHAHS